MILEMNNIRKHFDGLGVLEDISFSVEKVLSLLIKFQENSHLKF